jgi:alkaline phosphatase D
MKAFICVLISGILVSQGIGVRAQDKRIVLAGPMLGQVELRTASIWIEAASSVIPDLRYWEKGAPGKISYKQGRTFAEAVQQGFNPVLFTIGGLDPQTIYEYQFTFPGDRKSTVKADGRFTTRELWQFRKPAPDFSFITGSCSYMNQPPFDRPGRPYGGDSSIFESMARENSAFMLWLGDNWYTREVDYFSTWGLWERAHYDRSRPVLQPLLRKMSQYAIWDDHDFGPNDMGKEFVLKEDSRNVFSAFWANPSYGEYGKGIYSKISYSDADIFLLDDRTWRSQDNLSDSVGGVPNPEKRMFGVQQLEWLKNALAGSAATFKIIATGSQVLNPVSPFDCFRKFPAEYQEFMDFLKREKISGVIFLTGDRHHSEVIRITGLTDYPLYDVTVSPLTSGTHVFGAAEKDNPFRVLGIDQKQNYARISITGKPKDRKLNVEFLGLKGDKIGEWSVTQNELMIK